MAHTFIIYLIIINSSCNSQVTFKDVSQDQSVFSCGQWHRICLTDYFIFSRQHSEKNWCLTGASQLIIFIDYVQPQHVSKHLWKGDLESETNRPKVFLSGFEYKCLYVMWYWDLFVSFIWQEINTENEGCRLEKQVGKPPHTPLSRIAAQDCFILFINQGRKWIGERMMTFDQCYLMHYFRSPRAWAEWREHRQNTCSTCHR